MDLSKLHEHGKQEKFEHFGNDFGIHRNRVDAAIYINEALDNPITFIRRNSLGKGF